MPRNCEIRLSGSGGQGLILAGIVLAEAALLEGKNAIQTQSYGPEARGGSSKAEVIISEDEIDFPKVQRPHIVLALTQAAYDKYASTVRTGGTIIADESVEIESWPEDLHIYKLPIIKTASEKIGKAYVANIVAIGILTEVTGIVSLETVESAVMKRVPKGTETLNHQALYAGFALAEEHQLTL